MNWADKVNNFKKSYVGKSYSQLGQDLFVLVFLDCMHDVYFVEFGAMDGIHLSNTYLLEKNYNWTGILCEPGNVFKENLKQNRKCIIDDRAVTGRSGDQLMFKEVDIEQGLSGLVEYFHEEEFHTKNRKASSGAQYLVNTVSLNDLLIEHNAPKHINYMSIDTEGSETDILKNFKFDGYQIDILTVEHNHVEENKIAVQNILINQGYMVCQFTQPVFEDWFIHTSLLKD